MTYVYIILSYITYYIGNLISKTFYIDRFLSKFNIFSIFSFLLFPLYSIIMEFSGELFEMAGNRGPWKQIKNDGKRS